MGIRMGEGNGGAHEMSPEQAEVLGVDVPTGPDSGQEIARQVDQAIALSKPGGDIEEPDNWKHRSQVMKCATCMWYVPKVAEVKLTQDECVSRTETLKVGRCRRRAPTLNGWPAMYATDWCGDHKLDEEKVDAAS